jgi:hypothetical protein
MDNEEQQQHDKQNGDSGLEIRLLGSSVRISGESIRDVLRFLNGDRRFFVRALAIALLIWAACWGASLLR